MDEVKIEKFLYYTNGRSSDKVWGILSYNGTTLFKFWGRRGSISKDVETCTLNKETVDGRGGFDKALKKAISAANKKIASGYRELSSEEIDALVPGFKENIPSRLVMAQLSDDFRNMRRAEVDD